MTHAFNGKYYQKHPDQDKVASSLKQEILQRVENNNISCASAEIIARVSKVALEETGLALDILNIKIVDCQLGLFGYNRQKKVMHPTKEINASVKEEIERSLISGCLSCADAWEISRKLNLPRMMVSAACEELNIKIKPCQLGVF